MTFIIIKYLYRVSSRNAKRFESHKCENKKIWNTLTKLELHQAKLSHFRNKSHEPPIKYFFLPNSVSSWKQLLFTLFFTQFNLFSSFTLIIYLKIAPLASSYKQFRKIYFIHNITRVFEVLASDLAFQCLFFVLIKYLFSFNTIFEQIFSTLCNIPKTYCLSEENSLFFVNVD